MHSPDSFYHWAIRGFGAVLKAIEGYQREGLPMSEANLYDIEHIAQRLNKIAEIAKGKATSHLPTTQRYL